MGGTTENEKDRHSPCLLFLKKSIKNEGTITFKTFFKGVRGDPGGSSLVSYDTKQTTEQETPLTFSRYAYFQSSACDSSLAVTKWGLRDLMLLIPPPICAYWHISSNIRLAVFSACASISATVYEK